MSNLAFAQAMASVLAAVMALSGCAANPPADADARAWLVGNWYGELVCENCEDGRDTLRWTRLNLPNGNQRVHFQYYSKGKVVQNVVRTGKWGYAGGIYWLTCEEYVVDGVPKACPDTRYDFIVESMSPRRMTYRSEKYGVRYTAGRVADDFRLAVEPRPASPPR